MRLDKYLKVSRIIKRRTVASEAASLGRIQINGKVQSPQAKLRRAICWIYSWAASIPW